MESLLYSTADIAEQKTIQHIVYTYYCEHYKNPQQAFDEYKKLNTFIKQHPDSTHLVRFGRIVFLLKSTTEGIEFHSLGRETSGLAYVKNIRALIDYVQALGANALYSYSTDPGFDIVMRRMRLDITKDIRVGPDGVTYSYYRLEF